jgi:hypothetical protein
MARRPVVRPHPLSFQQRTIAAASSAKAIENEEKAVVLEQQVESLESDPFFVTVDGGGAVVEADIDTFDGGAPDA